MEVQPRGCRIGLRPTFATLRPVGVTIVLRLVGLVAATAPGGARLASAQVEQVPLTWNAPPGCPTAAAVLTDVKRNLAESGEARGPFVAVVNVSGPTDGVWQASLRVETRGGRAERRFQGESCESVASAAALIIALSAEGGSDAPPPKPDEEVPTVVADSPSGPYWGRRQLSVAVNGLVDGGTMPETAGGLEAAAGPSWTSAGWRLRLLGGVGFFPVQHTQPLSVDSAFWLLTFAGRGCVTTLVTRFEMGFCFGAELAVMDTEHVGVDFANSPRLWLSPLGSVVASWNVTPRVAVFGRGDVLVPGARRTFSTEAGEEAYTVPASAARGALGVELRFY